MNQNKKIKYFDGSEIHDVLVAVGAPSKFEAFQG